MTFIKTIYTRTHLTVKILLRCNGEICELKLVTPSNIITYILYVSVSAIDKKNEIEGKSVRQRTGAKEIDCAI